MKKRVSVGRQLQNSRENIEMWRQQMSFCLNICHLDMQLNTTQDQPNFVVISEVD